MIWTGVVVGTRIRVWTSEGAKLNPIDMKFGRVSAKPPPPSPLSPSPYTGARRVPQLAKWPLKGSMTL